MRIALACGASAAMLTWPTIAQVGPARVTPPDGFLSIAAHIKSRLYEAPKRRVRVMTSSGATVDLMLHHGGAYSVRERARLDGRVRDGAVLVLLDSHADLMDQVGLVPRPATAAEADWIEYDIASHIVPSLADGLVNEVIHVGSRRLDRQGRLPAHLPAVRRLWVIRVRDTVGVETAILLEGERPTWTDALARAEPVLERRRRAVDAVLAPSQPPVERHGRSTEGLQLLSIRSTPVTLRTTFLDDLPDLTADPRSVLLDVDEDFFVLGPRDSPMSDSERGEVEQDVRDAMRLLFNRGVRPGSVSIALSPGYTPEDRMEHVTATLLASLEQIGFVRFDRSSGRELTVDVQERLGDSLPEVREARAAVAAAAKDLARVPGALVLCDAVIDRYRVAASAQQRRGRARSVLARTGNPDWPWQPAPVVIAQRELNGVGEAHALRADLLVRSGRYQEALASLFALDQDFSDAMQPVSVRQFAVGFGWIVGEGWQPRLSSHRHAHLFQVMAILLQRGDALRHERSYRAWPAVRRRQSTRFLSDIATFGPSGALMRFANRLAAEGEPSAARSTTAAEILTWLAVELEHARLAWSRGVASKLASEDQEAQTWR